MRVRALDSNGDWTFGSGQNDYLSGTSAVIQAIQTRLLMFLGDCFFATNQGIDWFTFLGGSKNQLALELAINAVILNTQSDEQNVISSVTTLSVAFNSQTRAFTVSYSAVSIYGAVEGTVNTNIGVGPLAPPVSNLLPQFNQPLLNNVGATVINSAIFNSAFFWGVDLPYYIERRSTAGEYVQRGVLILVFEESSSTWLLTDNIASGSSGAVTGVTFTIDPASGQVFYASDNLTGTGYVGNLIIQSGTAFKAGD